jgi:hypothetical protein
MQTLLYQLEGTQVLSNSFFVQVFRKLRVRRFLRRIMRHCFRNRHVFAVMSYFN